MKAHVLKNMRQSRLPSPTPVLNDIEEFCGDQHFTVCSGSRRSWINLVSASLEKKKKALVKICIRFIELHAKGCCGCKHAFFFFRGNCTNKRNIIWTLLNRLSIPSLTDVHEQKVGYGEKNGKNAVTSPFVCLLACFCRILPFSWNGLMSILEKRLLVRHSLSKAVHLFLPPLTA